MASHGFGQNSLLALYVICGTYTTRSELYVLHDCTKQGLFQPGDFHTLNHLRVLCACVLFAIGVPKPGDMLAMGVVGAAPAGVFPKGKDAHGMALEGLDGVAFGIGEGLVASVLT